MYRLHGDCLLFNVLLLAALRHVFDHSSHCSFSSGGPSDRVYLSFIGEAFAAQHGINVTTVNPQTLRLTGRAPQGNYGDILSEILYENSANEPGSVTREVLFAIVDIGFGFVSTATTFVTIIPVNDKANINFAGGARNLEYDEFSRTPLNLFNANDTITDSDGSTLEWLAIRLEPGVDPNDVLAADAGGTGLMVAITRVGNGEILLNISGDGTFAAYESVLSSVTFVNLFPGMENDTRILNVVTFDGETRCEDRHITIDIGGFNDPPLCFFGEVVSAV